MLKPYPYQQDIIKRFRFKEACALFLDAGCGKTIVSINLMREAYNTHRYILPTIIYCPIIVLENWKREIIQCSKVPEEAIGVVIGSKAKRLKIIKNEKHKILIVNYEATRSQELLEALIDFKARIVVCDESHKIKNHKLKTPKGKYSLTGAVLKTAEHSFYRQILSGTPIPQPEDIWSQYYFLDRGETFGDRFFSFKKRYFINKNAGWDSSKAFPNWVFNDSLIEEYKERMGSKAARLTREECVDLPDLQQITINVEPSSEQLKHYAAVKTALITWLEDQPDNPLICKNALTKVLRLSEILSGYMKLEDESIVELKHNPSLDALKEILEATGDNKVIVWSIFKNNYKHIAKMLEKNKIEYVEVHGGISAKKKIENVDIFNDRSNKVRVCIANPASGGVGINMKSAPYSVFYTLGHSLIDYEQSMARNYRSGSIDLYDQITHYFIQHKGMITQHIVESILKKKDLADTLLNIKEIKKFLERG